jgi:hypothetical protein
MSGSDGRWQRLTLTMHTSPLAHIIGELADWWRSTWQLRCHKTRNFPLAGSSVLGVWLPTVKRIGSLIAGRMLAVCVIVRGITRYIDQRVS